MSTPRIRRLPRVMPLAQVARDVLMIDPHEAYKMAKRGTLVGAFKIGTSWFISLPVMIAAMQREPDDACDPIEGLLSGKPSRRRL